MTEKLAIPNEVINTDWRDFQTPGTEKEEAEYISPSEVSKESIEKIKARNLRLGKNVLSIFKENEKSAA